VAEAEFRDGTYNTWGKVLKMTFVTNVDQLVITVGGDNLELDPSKLYTILIVFVKSFEELSFDGMDLALDP